MPLEYKMMEESINEMPMSSHLVLGDERTGECDVWSSCLSHLQVLGVSGGNEHTDEGRRQAVSLDA
jgi:hypothetical protein